MRRRILRLAAGAVCLSAAALAGCGGPGQVIEIRYDRPPREQIPARIRSVAVTPFGGRTHEEEKWGSVAADKSAALLDEYNRKFKRYKLVDRLGLKQILDERRLQMALSDPDSAPKVAKIAQVDALIYGRVAVAGDDDRIKKTVIDWRTQRPKTVWRKRRTVNVNVAFQMIDKSSKVLIALSASRSYDSEKPKKEGDLGSKLSRLAGLGGEDLSPRDQIVNDLITECVHEVIATISPHEEVVREELEKGKSEHVKTGNALAVTGEYKEALDCYLDGIEAKPDDHGAMFNAGLMCEAMGNLAKAEGFYDRAFRLDPKKSPKYARARRRARVEKTD